MQAQGEHLPAGGGGRGGVAALATASRGRNGGGGRRRRLLLLRVGHRGGRDGKGGGSGQCHVRSVRDVVKGILFWGSIRKRPPINGKGSWLRYFRFLLLPWANDESSL